MVCFCFPLETHLSSITVYNAALFHLNGGVKQLAKTKMYKLDNITLEQGELRKQV
jgi:hypothetical protein